ncbi:MAG TPA: hydrogenase maturation peptidase HycI [Methanoregulaceae archaeon]|nr:hydrogenase maturation peptidase HycI [Methanoregulaceae archaeon]
MPDFSSCHDNTNGKSSRVMAIVRMLLGIGNTLRSDDGIGNYIASRFHARGWLALNCGTMPENFTAVVRRHHPEILVLVDATELGLDPGEFRIVSEEQIEDVSVGTHNLPLSFLIRYLAESAGQVIFIGIQPGHLGEGEGISPAVKTGAEQLITLLIQNRIREIRSFEGREKCDERGD